MRNLSGGRLAGGLGLALVAALTALLPAVPAMAQGKGGNGKTAPAPRGQVGTPSPLYFAYFSPFYDGDYREALKGFQSEYRSGIKTPTSRWIDSICYLTMVGECQYQMGRYGEALDSYTGALRIYYAFSDWMMRVQFPPLIRPANPGAYVAVPWGASQRPMRLGVYPDNIPIAQGRINNNDVIQRGGVVQQALMFSINVPEIVRCTCLSLRRRRELMGPVGVHDKLSGQLVSVLSTGPSLPNHWSQTWVDVQLGLAYAAAGKDAQAATVLERAIVAGGEFDHPLTATALLELGRLAMNAGDFAKAETLFAEATYSAVNYRDTGVVEEAFRYGFLNHVVGNRPGGYPLLAGGAAANWAGTKRYRQLQASILLSQAEQLCLSGNPRGALELLSQVRSGSSRRTMSAGRIGARLNYLTALANFQLQDVAAGESAQGALMSYQGQDGGSLWMFQMALVDGLWTSGAATDREAMELFRYVLREPTAADWLSDPVESLSSMVVPHEAVYEHWLEVALRRGEYGQALEIGDLIRRHRFLTRLDLGGRIHALRWMLEGPGEMLTPQAHLERQDLLVRYPIFAELSAQSKALAAELAALPDLGTDGAISSDANAKFKEWSEIAGRQEALLRELALRREACSIAFPPRRTLSEIQHGLPEGHALLAFLSTSRGYLAFLMTNKDNEYGLWPVVNLPTIQKQFANFVKGWGNIAQKRQFTVDELSEAEWKEPGRAVLDLLMKDSKADLATMFQEIVIVPDGLLWHVPFEALQVPDGQGGSVPLISKVRVRYAPTAALGVGDPRPRPPASGTAVVLGKLFAREDDQVGQVAFDELSRMVSGARVWREPLPASSALLSPLVDQLVVFAEITPPSRAPWDWSPVQIDRGRQGSTLGQWLALPWGSPDTVILPGFQAPLETGSRRSDATGVDMFLTTCGLMATGTRTILISRWRTGGQTTYDLIREFAQEAERTSPADAWQRSVLLAQETPLNVDAEPRLNGDLSDEPLTASHPYFWAGLMLVDSGPEAPAPSDKPAPKGANLAEADEPRPPDENGPVAAPEGRFGAAEQIDLPQRKKARDKGAAKKQEDDMGALPDDNAADDRTAPPRGKKSKAKNRKSAGKPVPLTGSR